MTNIVTSIENKILSLKIDLTEPGSPSKSGKTTVIASTNGNIEIAPGIFLGVNVYKKKG